MHWLILEYLGTDWPQRWGPSVLREGEWAPVPQQHLGCLAMVGRPDAPGGPGASTFTPPMHFSPVSMKMYYNSPEGEELSHVRGRVGY